MSFSYHDDNGDGVPIATDNKRIIYINNCDPDAESNRVTYKSNHMSECVECGKRFKSVTGYQYHINHVCDINQRFHFKAKEHLEPLPTVKRQVIYCAGAQDSGKSYRLASYIFHWLKLFPDRPVIVISRHDYDETFNMDSSDGWGNLEKRIQRMKPSIDWVENKFRLDEFTDCLVAFDDITCSNWSSDPDPKQQSKDNKAIQEYLYDLADDLASNARHHNVTLFVTNHSLYDRNRGLTKLLKDVTDTIVFPLTATPYHMIHYLKQYIGLEKDSINDVLASHCRWVWIHKTYPRYFMTDKEIKRFDLRLGKPKSTQENEQQLA